MTYTKLVCNWKNQDRKKVGRIANLSMLDFTIHDVWLQ